MVSASAQRRRRRKRTKELLAGGAGGAANGGGGDAGQAGGGGGDKPADGQVGVAGRVRGGAFGSGFGSDGWRGSVSDSALEDEELEEENIQKMNARYNPPQRKKNGGASPVKEEQPRSLMLSKSAELRVPRRPWGEEEEEERVVVSRGVIGVGVEDQKTVIEESGEKEVCASSSDTTLVGEVGVREGEEEGVEGGSITETKAGEGESLEFDSPSRGRTRMRSSSSGTLLDNPEPSPPSILLVRRTRARSQPPSKEAPDGQTNSAALLAAKADSLPELQLAEFRKSYKYNKSKDTHNIADDQILKTARPGSA